MTKNYVTPGEAARILGVCDRTLRYWEEQGKITAIRTAGGQRRYDITTYTTGATEDRVIILYARVSSTKQKEDLQRQCEYLQSQYPDGELVKEVGGGLNYKRKKMLTILERVMSGNVKRIVVTYKDRLARFGFDLLEWFCTKHSCEIVVLNKVEFSPEREMVEDILSMLHCFSARLYGLRKYSSQISKDQSLPRKKSPSNLETVVSSK